MTDPGKSPQQSIWEYLSIRSPTIPALINRMARVLCDSSAHIRDLSIGHLVPIDIGIPEEQTFPINEHIIAPRVPPDDGINPPPSLHAIDVDH
jgi:hypothetical protein